MRIKKQWWAGLSSLSVGMALGVMSVGYGQTIQPIVVAPQSPAIGANVAIQYGVEGDAAANERMETVLAHGAWVEKSYPIAGTWSLVMRDAQRVLVFDADFATRRGPDLKVYLSRKPIASLRDGNVESTSVKIAALQSNAGAQEYLLPDMLVLDEFTAIVIHCEAYAHLWGGADVRTDSAAPAPP